MGSVTFDQSDDKEGHQDQYYPSCGQLYIKSNLGSQSLNPINTVSFPGAYPDGNIKKSTTPGPSAMYLTSDLHSEKKSNQSLKSNQSKLKSTSIDHQFNPSLQKPSKLTPSQKHVSTSIQHPSPSSSSSTTTTSSTSFNASTHQSTVTSSSSDKKHCLPTTVPTCGKICLNKKLQESGSLAPGCSTSDGNCLCSKSNFVKAYENCARDHCLVESLLLSYSSSSSSSLSFFFFCNTFKKKQNKTKQKTDRSIDFFYIFFYWKQRWEMS